MNMQSMKAFIVRLNFPVFSLKLPLAFQVADTSLLPSPSSLRGALAKSLAYFHPFNSDNFQDAVEGWLHEVEEFVPVVTVKPESEIMKGSVILSRLRTLEQRGREDPRDAMRRGIVFVRNIKACYIVDEEKAKKSLGKSALKQIEEALWLIDRVGDTESLSSISGVEGPLELSISGSEGEINTLTNETFVEKVTGHAYIDSMDSKFVYELTGKDRGFKKVRISRLHYLPLKAERINEFLVYIPSCYRVKARKSKICTVNDMKIVVGEDS